MVLSLANNRFHSLPTGLYRLKNLRSLNISGNPDLVQFMPIDINTAGTKEILKFLQNKEKGKLLGEKLVNLLPKNLRLPFLICL